jgi:hypothetical protein
MQKYCFLSVFLTLKLKIQENDIGYRRNRFGWRAFVMAFIK